MIREDETAEMGEREEAFGTIESSLKISIILGSRVDIFSSEAAGKHFSSNVTLLETTTF